MSEEVQIYTADASGKVTINPDHEKEIRDIGVALQTAVGKNAVFKTWQYRHSNLAHIAFDVEGEAGAVSCTLVVTGSLKLPTNLSIADGDPEFELYDSVDAFYFLKNFVEAISASS